MPEPGLSGSGPFSQSDGFGHVDVGQSASIGVWHHARDDVPELSIEQKRMATTEVANLRDVPRNVSVKVNPGEGGHSRIVVRTEGHRERSSVCRLRLERCDQRASDTSAPVLSPDHDGVELPYAAVVLRKATYPTKKSVGIERGAGKAAFENASYLFAPARQGRPTARLVEVLDKQPSRLVTNWLGLIGKINDLHVPCNRESGELGVRRRSSYRLLLLHLPSTKRRAPPPKR